MTDMTVKAFEGKREAELEMKLAEGIKKSLEVAKALDRGDKIPHAEVVDEGSSGGSRPNGLSGD